jgi:hypothetical protein
MTRSAALPDTDPRHHTAIIRGLLAELAEHCREDIKKIEEPKAQALLVLPLSRRAALEALSSTGRSRRDGGCE